MFRLQKKPLQIKHKAMSHHDHTFQGRKKKLSGWVKRIIQPRDPGISPLASAETTDEEDDSVSMKVLWDAEPIRAKSEPLERDLPSEATDNVSITPLFSMCSSSVKSSTFSDSHSIQSTRATVLSGRTVETNSSTMAIPPASIIGRTRASSATQPSSSASSAGPSAVAHHLHQSRPASIRHTQLQRDPSSTTVNSSSTIK